MTKREMNERNIKIKAQDLITLRNKKDLSFDFMENYLTKFKPELLEKFYDLVAYGSNGKELCFGKYDYKKHVFTLKYTLSNFVFNVSDSQVIYFNFIDKNRNKNYNRYADEMLSKID